MTDDYNYIKETCVYHLTWHLMSKRVNSFVVSVTLRRRGIFSREDKSLEGALSCFLELYWTEIVTADDGVGTGVPEAYVG